MDVIYTAEGFEIRLPNGSLVRKEKVSLPLRASEYQKTNILRERVRQVMTQLTKHPPKILVEWRKQNEN